MIEFTIILNSEDTEKFFDLYERDKSNLINQDYAAQLLRDTIKERWRVEIGHSRRQEDYFEI